MVLYAAERRSKKLFSMCTIQLALAKRRFVFVEFNYRKNVPNFYDSWFSHLSSRPSGTVDNTYLSCWKEKLLEDMQAKPAVIWKHFFTLFWLPVEGGGRWEKYEGSKKLYDFL